MITEIEELLPSSIKGLLNLKQGEQNGYKIVSSTIDSTKMHLIYEACKNSIADGFVFYFSQDAENRPNLVIIDSTDRDDIIRAAGTQDANNDVDTEGLIKKLQNIDNKYPFEVIAASSDWLSLVLTVTPQQPTKLAKLLYKICPDLSQSDDFGDQALLAKAIEQGDLITLWWD